MNPKPKMTLRIIRKVEDGVANAKLQPTMKNFRAKRMKKKKGFPSSSYFTITEAYRGIGKQQIRNNAVQGKKM